MLIFFTHEYQSRFVNVRDFNVVVFGTLGPDYMSRTCLPVSRVASVCREPGGPGSHVIAKLICIAFNKRAEIPAN